MRFGEDAMHRRAFVGLALAVLGVARSSSAQQGRVWRVGFLYFGSRQSLQETGRYAAFLQGMRELGYAEGKSC